MKNIFILISVLIPNLLYQQTTDLSLSSSGSSSPYDTITVNDSIRIGSVWFASDDLQSSYDTLTINQRLTVNDSLNMSTSGAKIYLPSDNDPTEPTIGWGNNGIYYNGAGELRLAVGGTRRWNISSTLIYSSHSSGSGILSNTTGVNFRPKYTRSGIGIGSDNDGDGEVS